ncbi:hypothetical protein G6F68_013247 [Rhizopus microsporus]|nr:hypothetical protein G6F68_013247 [Rhizopus microsporus]
MKKTIQEITARNQVLETQLQELHNENQKLKSDEPIAQEVLPPRLSDCLTPSYRHGPKHNPLTLYHTMKMKTGQERTQAYALCSIGQWIKPLVEKVQDASSSKRKSIDILEPTDILLAVKTLLPQGSTITIQINRDSIYD